MHDFFLSLFVLSLFSHLVFCSSSPMHKTTCVKEYNHQLYTAHSSCPWSGSVITWKRWYTLCAFQVKMGIQGQKVVQGVSERYQVDVNCLLPPFDLLTEAFIRPTGISCLATLDEQGSRLLIKVSNGISSFFQINKKRFYNQIPE